MATELEELYEKDFYAWTRRQAKALRALAKTRPNVPVDWRHLIDEVEGLGRNEWHAVRSQLRRLIEHLLKLARSPACDPRRGWVMTAVYARQELADRLTATLKRRLRRELGAIYAEARRAAKRALELYDEHEAASRLPEACPWTLEQILDPEFFPEPEEGGDGD